MYAYEQFHTSNDDDIFSFSGSEDNSEDYERYQCEFVCLHDSVSAQYQQCNPKRQQPQYTLPGKICCKL